MNCQYSVLNFQRGSFLSKCSQILEFSQVIPSLLDDPYLSTDNYLTYQRTTSLWYQAFNKINAQYIVAALMRIPYQAKVSLHFLVNKEYPHSSIFILTVNLSVNIYHLMCYLDFDYPHLLNYLLKVKINL